MRDNLWNGFGCRWSGSGKIINCNLINNGCGAWGIRKSTIGNIIRENNKDDKTFKNLVMRAVAFLWVDPLDTMVPEKGLGSRGLSL